MAPPQAEEMEGLNYSLDDLQLDGTDRFAEGAAVDGAKFSRTCAELLSRLRHYDDRVGVPDGSRQLSAKDVYEAVRAREPHFALDANQIEYRLLHFLCTHLQAERIRKHSSRGDSRREAAAATGKMVFQLEKICQDLGTDTSEDGVSLTSAQDVSAADGRQCVPAILLS